MSRETEFDNILNECLERLLLGGETVEQCLRSYPGEAAELEPLLRTTVRVEKAAAVVPNAVFKARTKYQLLSALDKPEPGRWQSFIFSLKPRWAAVIVAVLIVLVAGGTGVATAGSSMPDSLLYPVKLATEQLQLKLSPTELGRTELYARLADRRVNEIVYMVEKGDIQQIELTAGRLNGLLAGLADKPGVDNASQGVLMAPEPAEGAMEQPTVAAPRAQGVTEDSPPPDSEAGKVRILLEEYALSQTAAISAAINQAPEEVRPVLKQLVTDLESSYTQVIGTLD